MTIPFLLTIILFTPLAGAILLMFLPRDDALIKRVSIAVSVIPLVLSVVLWLSYNQAEGAIQFHELYSWIPALNVRYHLGVDGISIPFVFLTALLTTLALYYSSRSAMITQRVREFFALFLMLEMGLFGVFMALDLVLFYIFWEIGLVPMFLLIGIWGQEKDRPQYSAIKFFLYTLVGSVTMLLAFIGIYLATGTFDILQLAQARPLAENFLYASLAFWGIFLAFAIKVPLFPFHTWLPDAHTAAPTAGSVLLAGVLLKLGAYGFIRILIPSFPDMFQFYAPLIGVLAVVSIVYGALVCMAQWDLKRLIAYSSVSHMGYVMLGIVAAVASAPSSAAVLDSRVIALNGATLQMFNHGIITGGMFFLVGMLYERTHTRDLKEFGGLAARVPVYYGVMMVTGLASLGLPGLAGFISEFLVFRGAFGVIPLFAGIAALGIVVTAAYILWKVMMHLFMGESANAWSTLTDIKPFEVLAMAPLLFFMVFVGVYPAPILDLIGAATRLLLARA